MNIPSMNTKLRQVILHVLAWLIIFSIPYLLSSQYVENRPKNPEEDAFYYLNTITDLFWIGVFYLNSFLLTPKLLYAKKYLLFSALLLCIFCCIILIHGLLFSFLIHSRSFVFLQSFRFFLPTFILTVAVSSNYQFIQDKAKTDKHENQKHEENLKTELSFLRSQISPHFIFNVLNNIVALVRMKSDELEPTVMKLSSLMQYMLYETDEEQVLLKSEVEYLQSYIDLQQQRFGSKVKMSVSLNLNESSYEIEPMLLIPFVENAFKHGVGLIEHPQINIELYTKDSNLYFFIRNKYNSITDETKDKTSGIGLTNVKRRLNLLYGNNHTLIVNNDGHWYSVSLQIKLH
jgi:two-component system LytT family sensor kinase